MEIKRISFNGYYKEGYIMNNRDKNLISELRQARPFLRQIAYSMPNDKDLFVRIEKNEDGKDVLKTYCVENDRDREPVKIAETTGCRYSMGLGYTQDVIKGIRNNYPEIYHDVIETFVTKLKRIDNEIINSRDLPEERKDIFNKIYP